jgi:hypothetical protein
MNAPYRSPNERVPPRGLPDHLPEGERLLWQGGPTFWNLACQAFHIRKIAAYFAVLLAWRIGGALADGASLVSALHGAIPLTVLSALGLGAVGVIAWLSARTTVYTITSRRLVMHCGIALPMSVNIPFAMIASAALKTAGDGSGDIAVALPAGQRIAYLSLWPHVRRWRFSQPEPSLRSLPNAAFVGEILARSLVASVGGKSVPANAPAPAITSPAPPHASATA